MRKEDLIRMSKKVGMGFSIAMLAGGLTACDSEKAAVTEAESSVEAQVNQSEEIVEIAESTEETQEASEQTQEASESQASAVDSEAEVTEDGISILCPSEYLGKSADVKYSDVIHTSYYSTTCEKERNVNILLPADYSEDKEYPVFYFLHGIFGDENSMIGCGPTIENMMAKGAAEEMIIVFPYMYASKTQDACTAIDGENIAAYDNFVNDLVNDLMPYIKENYSVKEGKENTAIAGFSMGGRESLAIGLLRPDLFGYVGAFSPAPGLVPGKDWAYEHPGQFAEEEVAYDDEKHLLLMICCGDSDKVVGTFPKSYHELYEKNGIDHFWWEIPGSDHGDPAISSGVYNFCSRIFQ